MRHTWLPVCQQYCGSFSPVLSVRFVVFFFPMLQKDCECTEKESSLTDVKTEPSLLMAEPTVNRKGVERDFPQTAMV